MLNKFKFFKSMSKRHSHKFWSDFFSWKHVVIWVVLVILVGVGIVWAATTVDQKNLNGHKLATSSTLRIDDSSGLLGPCVIVSNKGNKSYFVPTRTGNEFTHFKNAVADYLGLTTSASLSVYACPSGACTPSDPCGTKECGTDDCGNSCGTCASGYVCDTDQMCVLLKTNGCGNPAQICPQGYYCSYVANPQGVCLPIGIY